MGFLWQELATLERLLPGLDDALAAIPLLEMERRGNPAIAVFRQLDGPGLLMPEALGGRSTRGGRRSRRHTRIGAPSLLAKPHSRRRGERRGSGPRLPWPCHSGCWRMHDSLSSACRLRLGCLVEPSPGNYGMPDFCTTKGANNRAEDWL
jgi:hypothetical protein